jgi:mannose-6-phosphate isomerase-like protein (cupin superfamily)
MRIWILAVLPFLGSHSASAQPKDISPEIRAELERSPKPPPANDEVGVSINRFVGNPFQSPVRVVDEVIFKRVILKAGDPYKPGEPGAVLEYRKDLSHGTVLAHARTPLTQSADQQFWYIQKGEARLDDNESQWDLRPGFGVLIPPKIRYRLENTADDPLEMLMLTWTPEGGTTRPDILVRDVRALGLPARGSHWNYFGTDFMSPQDGLHRNEQFAVVYMPPMTIAEPHAHIPHWEEIWTKLEPDSSYLMLGSEVREMPPNTAFLSPPNGRTVHSVVNLSKERTQAFLYIGHWVWKQGPRAAQPSIKGKPLR